MDQKPMITEGARLLRAHLLHIDRTVPDFCEKHGLSRRIVQRALSGEQVTFSVDFALDVEKATGGAVCASSWRQSTLKEASSDEVGRIFSRQRGKRSKDDTSEPAAA